LTDSTRSSQHPETTALAEALASLSGEPTAESSESVVNAALLRVEIERRGHDVVLFRRYARPSQMAVAAVQFGLAAIRGRDQPTPRDRVEGEHILDFLRALDFDVYPSRTGTQRG
jgi:hypothetical protein